MKQRKPEFSSYVQRSQCLTRVICFLFQFPYFGNDAKTRVRMYSIKQPEHSQDEFRLNSPGKEQVP